MTTLIADHLTDEQVESSAPSPTRCRPGRRRPRSARRPLHPPDHRGAARAGGRGRALLLFAKFPPAWIAGTAALSVAKILENMELGHNIMHGQWDWMRDPKIHSTTWEWDHACAAEGWKHSHNFEHHTFTNVLGKDRDLGYSIMRVSPEQPWHPVHLLQPVYNQALALFFEWGVAFYDLEVDLVRDGKSPEGLPARPEAVLAQDAPPAREGLRGVPCAVGGVRSAAVVASMAASFVANLARNFWAHAVIFCGHFPEGVEPSPRSSSRTRPAGSGTSGR